MFLCLISTSSLIITLLISSHFKLNISWRFSTLEELVVKKKLKDEICGPMKLF